LEYQQRRLIAAAVLVIAFLVMVYLLFYSPPETRLELPTAVGTVAATATASS